MAMCVAASGKVISIEGRRARVDFLGNVCDVNVSLVNARIGDYVLVHAGCAIEVVKKETNDEIVALWREIEAMENDEDE